MRALMIQHRFPPGGPMGAQRARRLTHQLPGLGIEPLVVAAAQSTAAGRPEPAVEIIDGVPVVVARVRGLDPIAWYQRRTRSRGRASGPTG